MADGLPESTVVTRPMSPFLAAEAVAKFLKSLPGTEGVNGRYLEVSITATHGPERVSVFSVTVDQNKAS